MLNGPKSNNLQFNKQFGGILQGLKVIESNKKLDELEPYKTNIFMQVIQEYRDIEIKHSREKLEEMFIENYKKGTISKDADYVKQLVLFIDLEIVYTTINFYRLIFALKTIDIDEKIELIFNGFEAYDEYVWLLDVIINRSKQKDKHLKKYIELFNNPQSRTITLSSVIEIYNKELFDKDSLEIEILNLIYLESKKFENSGIVGNWKYNKQYIDMLNKNIVFKVFRANLKKINFFDEYKKLKIDIDHDIMDFKYLIPLSKLKVIDCFASEYKNIQELEKLKKLRSFGIKRDGVIDLEDIKSLINLENLDIKAYKIHNINDIVHFQNLESLTLISNEYMYLDKNPSLFSTLNKLKSLKTNKLENIDMEDISKIKKLEKLDIRADSIDNLLAIKKLKNLKVLKFYAYIKQLFISEYAYNEVEVARSIDRICEHMAGNKT